MPQGVNQLAQDNKAGEVKAELPSSSLGVPFLPSLSSLIPSFPPPSHHPLLHLANTQSPHDWAPSLSLFTFMHWGRKWQPTPVFLPGESQGRGSLVGCCLWGRTESDTPKATCRSSEHLTCTKSCACEQGWWDGTVRSMSARDEAGRVCCGQAQPGVSESYLVLALQGVSSL